MVPYNILVFSPIKHPGINPVWSLLMILDGHVLSDWPPWKKEIYRLNWLSPGHKRHPSAVRSVCGLFAAENCRDRSITLRLPQGVGLNRRGRAVQNQWSWTLERYANMFANQSTVRSTSQFVINIFD